MQKDIMVINVFIHIYCTYKYVVCKILSSNVTVRASEQNSVVAGSKPF